MTAYIQPHYPNAFPTTRFSVGPGSPEDAPVGTEPLTSKANLKA
jgi:hypothetical protein